jgi:hypothetical protein
MVLGDQEGLECKHLHLSTGIISICWLLLKPNI